MIKRLKLKYQLYFLVLVTIVLFCIFSLLYYISFRTITYERAENTAQQMIEQVAQNVVNMADGIENSATGLIYYSTYAQDLMISNDPAKNLVTYEKLSEMVNAAKTSNSNIYSITWISDDYRMISDPGRDDNDIVTKLLAKYQFTQPDFRTPMFSSMIRADNGFHYFGYIFPVYSLKTMDMPKVGCGIFVLNVWELEKLVKINNITENSLFVILDHENNVIVSNRDLKTGDVYQDVFWTEEQTEVKDRVDYNGMESVAQCMHVAETGWKIVSIIPLKDLSSGANEVMRNGVILMILITVLLTFLGHGIIYNITTPIHSIVRFLRDTEPETLNKRMEIPEQAEIAVIASSMNGMLDRVEQMTSQIVEHQARLYESRLAERDAELAALQSQINPHFLYNTLNCISSIGLAYDIPEISDISVAMSNIYRYSIKGDQMVPLSRELQCIKEYMRIMDIRFGGKFETEYRFPEELLELYTLRMILQPIVENAVYHGMELRNQKGRLLLEGAIREDGKLILTIVNNGKGMSPEVLEALQKHILEYESAGLYNAEKSSIGLGNINKRIKIQFGAQYGLFVESEEATGTRVTLVLPVLHEPEPPAKKEELP